MGSLDAVAAAFLHIRSLSETLGKKKKQQLKIEVRKNNKENKIRE